MVRCRDEVLQNIRYNPILLQIFRRVHDYDQNALIFVLGQTGSRKSGSAISWAMQLDPDFSLDRIVFTASDFMRLVEKGDVIRKPNGELKYRKLRTGSCIIWDEMGVEADNTEWNTAKAKLIKWTFTLFRMLNLVVFMTSTHLTTVQIGVRRLVHGALDM